MYVMYLEKIYSLVRNFKFKNFKRYILIKSTFRQKLTVQILEQSFFLRNKTLNV